MAWFGFGRCVALILGAAALASCGPQEEAAEIVPVESADPAALAPIKPRGITLTMPLEHSLASGGIQTFTDRTRTGIAFAGPGQPPLPIFLNRFGGTYTPGQDDSRRNTSIVPNSRSTVSAFSGSNGQWASVVNCITTMFMPYNVVITETEPAGGEYVEAVIGGSPGQVGLPNGVGGVAPIDQFQCNIIPNAIVFAFSDVVGNDPQETCEIAAQEIAHAFSLDHEFHCPDPMTYLGGCGPKTFRDFDAQCGEYQARACNCGRSRQNSVQTLIQKLGTNNGGMPPPPPPNDPTPPVISNIMPADGAQLPENSTIMVSAEITDNLAVASTELVWVYSNAIFPCPGSSGGGAVNCTRSGNTSTWSIRVGQGTRPFRVRARDTAGNVTESAQRTIQLGTGMPPPTDNVPPTAMILTPGDMEQMPANSTIHITATAMDDVGLGSVELVWTFANDSFQCPFNGQGVSCTQNGNTYDWALAVGVGTRQFSVRAIDQAGNRFDTPARTITLTTTPMMPPNTGDIVGEENDTANDAFPLRCGNAIDLVVTNTDEDWFSIDAPQGTNVDVGVGAASNAVIAVELYAADGTTALNSTNDIVMSGGTIRGVSAGPRILVRVTTPSMSEGYRLTSMCSREEPMPPMPGQDDSLEDNDDMASAKDASCNEMKTNLVAMDPDFFKINVPAGNALHVTVTTNGAQASILDMMGMTLAPSGQTARTTALPGGEVVVKVDPTATGGSYGINLECKAPTGPDEMTPELTRTALAGGCSCSAAPGEHGSSSPAFLLVFALGALILRRRL